MEQATVVSDLKLQLVELRQNIANNPTPEVSEVEEGEATLVATPRLHLRLSPRLFLPKTLLWILRATTWMTISLRRSILQLQNAKESLGSSKFLRTDKNSSSGHLDWTVSLFVKGFSTFKHCMSSMKGKNTPVRLRPWNAMLVACLTALVLEVLYVSYVSESSWETAFSGDEFVTGGATWFETESGDTELVLSGYDVWNETDSLNSVLHSQKFVSFPSWTVFFKGNSWKRD